MIKQKSRKQRCEMIDCNRIAKYKCKSADGSEVLYLCDKHYIKNR